MNMQRAIPLLVLVVGGLTGGCVRRTMTIQTEPAGALVYLNDQEVGRSPVSVDFTWYGDYDLIIRKQGYESLRTHVQVVEPWYQIPPVDFFAEVLWPGHIHDERTFAYVLDAKVLPDREEILQRADEFRDRALYEVD
ncbi:MAG: PEGA domain-containing protein [Phycisphaerales bacterium]|nr:MAG: PEGA domain-containing protein [Phycisphaerales bacterium]